MAAVQIGKLLGARVVAVVTGPDKVPFVSRQGADHVIDASALKQPLHQAIKAAAPKGAPPARTCCLLIPLSRNKNPTVQACEWTCSEPAGACP